LLPQIFFDDLTMGKVVPISIVPNLEIKVIGITPGPILARLE